MQMSFMDVYAVGCNVNGSNFIFYLYFFPGNQLTTVSLSVILVSVSVSTPLKRVLITREVRGGAG